jgi:SAM-dependent methyltransferase
VVLCSFNTLDYVAHADRLAALGEFRRVLAENGLLIFSSHNLNSPGARGGPRLAWSFHPLKLARNVAVFACDAWRHARNSRKEVLGDGHAILNDCGHGYRLLSYYIDKRRQAAQLDAAGFRLLECYDRAGRAIGLQDDDRGSSFIYYVARKQ